MGTRPRPRVASACASQSSHKRRAAQKKRTPKLAAQLSLSAWWWFAASRPCGDGGHLPTCACEGAVDEKEKKEEGKIIQGEVEVVVEGEVENKEDEAEGVNEEAEVEVSHRHESTPVCVLKVEEGPA